MAKYRKKPVVIEAVRWMGTNFNEMDEFLEGRYGYDEPTIGNARVVIQTLEGTMRADIGDWVIKGVQGEYYPCKPDIFEQTYEKVEE